jgi:hypothetical protein
VTRARRHRGGLAESMATVQPCSSLGDLVELINRDFADFGVKVDAGIVHVEPYVFDDRIGWDTYLVSIDGHGVWGMTDGPA